MTKKNAESNPRWSPTRTLVVASLALMMSFLDSLVVTTALPTLRVALHSSLANLEWRVNAYNLSFACLLLMGAALGDRFGGRRMLCIGLATTAGKACPDKTILPRVVAYEFLTHYSRANGAGAPAS